MKEFTPNYQNIVNAAFNKKSERLTLHELGIGSKHLNNVMGYNIWEHKDKGTKESMREFYSEYAIAHKKLTFDYVNCASGLFDFLNDAKSLKGHEPGPIQCRADFERIDWESIPEKFMEKNKELYTLTAETLP